MTVTSLGAERTRSAKRSFTTRHVPTEAMATLISGPIRPRAGSIVLARVERLGNHTRLELTTGRRANLHLGDEIIVTYADRYAPDQFEANVPLDLGPSQLVASGGIAAHVLSQSADVRRATDIIPLGLVGDARGVPLALSDFGMRPCPPSEELPPTVAVIGTSMNSGKTTTIRQLVLGLREAGHVPGVCKVTGTGSGGDYWVMLDAGAHQMLDFTDVGLASTYRVDFAVVELAMAQLVDHLAASGARSLLVEVADGLFQQETAELVASPAFQERVDGVVFAAADALGAVAGVDRLRSLDVPVIGVAGRLTRSPLAIREAEAACGVPVLTLAELTNPAVASSLLGLPMPPPVVEHPDPDPVLQPEMSYRMIELTDPAFQGLLHDYVHMKPDFA